MLHSIIVSFDNREERVLVGIRIDRFVACKVECNVVASLYLSCTFFSMLRRMNTLNFFR